MRRSRGLGVCGKSIVPKANRGRRAEGASAAKAEFIAKHLTYGLKAVPFSVLSL
jgi:hypothetical protein